MDWDAISAELQKKLDPKYVKPPPKGRYGEYIEGHHAIEEANRIFGHDGWSYRITRLEKASEQTVALKGQKGPYEQYRVGYSCTVVVSVDGVEREGSAFGSGMGNPDSMADHHESAIKEAETDALKRALRTFGNPFGLALYDKSKANVGAPEMTPAQKRDWVKNNISKAKSIDDLDAWLNRPDIQEAITALPEPMQNEITTAANAKRNALDPIMYGDQAVGAC